MSQRIADELEERGRRAIQHAAGRPVHFIARGNESHGAFMVVLEGKGIAVVAVRIRFDDQSLCRPEKVDEVLANQHVDGRLGEPSFSTQRQEVDLSRRFGVDGSRTDARRDPPQATGSRPERRAVEQQSQPRPAKSAGPISIDNRPLQLTVVKSTGEVKQGALD